jgi:hypothetical protein
MSVLQVRNPELVEILRPDFQARYEPNFAWANAISIFSMLPGLRGFWPLSTANESGNAYDLSEQGRILTYTGNPTYNVSGLAPYIDFDGVGDYLTRADEAGLDCLGNESYIAAAIQGITFGGWFWFDRDTNGEGLITKADGITNNNRNFDLLYRGDAGDVAQVDISNGANAYTITSTDILTTGVWYFLAGRFVPSTSVDVYVNLAKDTLAAGIPATANNSNAPFQIGARNGGLLLDGRANLCFLCAAALPDVIINQLFEQTRAMFGQ